MIEAALTMVKGDFLKIISADVPAKVGANISIIDGDLRDCYDFAICNSEVLFGVIRQAETFITALGRAVKDIRTRTLIENIMKGSG